jgi:CheY-like chemotaxis protein
MAGIVVITSYWDRQLAVACFRPAAWTGLVNKPVLEEALLAAVREAGRGGYPKALSREITSLSLQVEAKPRGFRILVCEDNLINQKVAMRMLNSQGHAVTIGDDGRKALAALEAEPFDVVLMDVQMPVMDGLEAVAEIRKREKSRGGHIPVIAMTAHTLKGDRERCRAAGMDGYVSKPIDKRQLFETLDRLTPQSSAT